ncbi:hypothetical protein [uncultured Victivallis sp.]|uniref:hypothetical protein n=1 Tax=uncultured Victivallis sp. TaxID=354118 RepID=UPI00258D01ED|nr:hypothetical protein [uncultured Victivallis sp.]
MNYLLTSLAAASLLCIAAAETLPDTAAAVRATVPGAVFQENEALEFTLDPAVAGTVRYEVRDWRGDLITSGIWPADGRGTLRLADLSRGYYQLSLSKGPEQLKGTRSFAIVADPEKRRRNPDSFFALDSAQSWLARPNPANPRFPGEGFETVSELARRAGAEHIRERLSWSDVEPARGQFTGREYQKNAELLHQRGIQVLGMYHNAPRWAKQHSSKLPDDLTATYEFARDAALRFAGKMTAWEFWNEQDIGFTDEPAWDYAACLKAAALGFKTADPGLPVLLGGIAVTPLAPYNDVVMQNGAAEYFDIFNVHTYRPLRDYPAILEDIRAFMKRHGIERHPLWFTENGSLAEGSGRLPSYLPGRKSHSPEQELLVAEFLPKCMVTMQSLGVNRDYFFVLCPYNEQNGGKDWGLLRHDYTAKPGYAAFATLTDRLGAAEYQGILKPAKNVRAFLYRQPDGSQTVIYWTLSELDRDGQRPDLTIADRYETTFTLAVADGTYRTTDLLGSPGTITAGNGRLELRAERFPAYVDGLSGLKPDIPAPPPSKQSVPSVEPLDKAIVFKTVLSPDFQLTAGKDRAELLNTPARLKLLVYNFSTQEKRGCITINEGKVKGLPNQTVIPAFGRKEFSLTFIPAAGQKEIVFRGVFQDKPASPLVIPISSLDGCRTVDLPNTSDPLNWKPNSSGKMAISFDPAEQAVCFHTKFPPNVDRWVYPEYTLQLPQESLHGAYALTFEVKATPDAIKQMLVMSVGHTGEKQEKAVHHPVLRPSEHWEKRTIYFDKQSEPLEIIRLRIGLNSMSDEITYRIRNIQVVYQQ